MEKDKAQKEQLTFVTGNKNKLIEFQTIVGDLLNVTSMNLDLPELQGEPKEIAKEKVMIAYRQIKKPVLIEDTSLCYNSLKGLPGPYIKWFLEKLGHEGLNKLLAAYEDKSAYAQCIFAYMNEGMKEPKLFVGQTLGKIVPARGPHNFGWDPIFEPDGFDKTYAELPKETKNKISHRYKALAALIEYFQNEETKHQ